MDHTHAARHRASFLILFLSSLLVLTGCESSTSPSAASDELIEVEPPSSKYMELSAIPTDIIEEAGNAEGVIQMMRPTFDQVETFLGDWKKASSLETKNDLAHEILSNHTDQEDFFLRSVAAERGLIAIMTSGEVDRHLASTKLYTDVLIENGSHNAELIHDALHALKGTWSESKINDAAQSTIDRSLVWLERTQGFADNKHAAAATDEQVASTVAGHDRATTTVKSGVQELSRLAD